MVFQAWLWLQPLLCGMVSVATVSSAMPKFPVQIEKDVASALEATRRTTIQHREPWNRVKEFDAALDRIAGLLTAEDERQAREYEGENIGAKLVLIAVNRRDHPEMYQEIFESYVKPQAPIARGLPARPQLAKAEHVTPAHRLAWDYYVLRPRAGRWRYREVCMAASVEAGSVRSIITIEEFCRLGKDDSLGISDSGFEGEQLVAINALMSLPHERSLRAALTCVRLQHELASRINSRATEYIPDWRLDDYVMRLFRTKPSPYDYSVDHVRWWPIIESFPRQGLGHVELGLLEQLIVFFRERNRTIPPVKGERNAEPSSPSRNEEEIR